MGTRHTSPVIVRFDNWPILLSTFIHSCRDKKFIWGEHDCLLFASSAINSMTGVDYAAPYRGKYTSEAEAMAFIKRDFGTLGNVGHHFFGDPLGYNANARRGDLVMCDFVRGSAYGIVDDTGRKACFVLEGGGLYRKNIDEKMMIWKVG